MSEEIKKLEKLLKEQQDAGDDKQYKTGGNLYHKMASFEYEKYNHKKAEKYAYKSMYLENIYLKKIARSTMSTDIKKTILIEAKYHINKSFSIYLRSKLLQNNKIKTLPELYKFLYTSTPNKIDGMKKEDYLETIGFIFITEAERRLDNHELTLEDLDERWFFNTDNFSSIDDERLMTFYVKVHNNLAKYYRPNARFSILAAQNAERHRIEAAKILENLGAPQKIILENYTEAALFNVLQSKNKDEFEKSYKKLIEINNKYYSVAGNEKHVYHNMAYAKEYGLKFRDSKDIQSLIAYLGELNELLNKAKSGKRHLYKNIMLFYRTVNVILESKTLLELGESFFEIYKTFKPEPSSSKEKARELGIYVEKTNQLIINIGLFLENIIGNRNNITTDKRLMALANLYKDNLIVDSLLLDILKEIVTREVTNLPLNVEVAIDKEDSNNFDELNTLLKNSESNKIEVKKSLDTSEICKTICAFGNTSGGSIIIGLEEIPTTSNELNKNNVLANRYVVVGMKNMDNYRQKLANIICNTLTEIDPSQLDYRERIIRGKNILIIDVPFAPNREPIKYKNNYYERRDNFSHPIQKVEEMHRLMKRIYS